MEKIIPKENPEKPLSAEVVISRLVVQANDLANKNETESGENLLIFGKKLLRLVPRDYLTQQIKILRNKYLKLTKSGEDDEKFHSGVNFWLGASDFKIASNIFQSALEATGLKDDDSFLYAQDILRLLGAHRVIKDVERDIADEKKRAAKENAKKNKVDERTDRRVDEKRLKELEEELKK